MVHDKFKTTCRMCHRQSMFRPTLIDGGRRFILVCPKCNSRGIFRNKDYVPFLFVKNIRLASRQYFAVLSSQHLLGDVGFIIKPLQFVNSPHRKP